MQDAVGRVGEQRQRGADQSVSFFFDESRRQQDSQAVMHEKGSKMCVVYLIGRSTQGFFRYKQCGVVVSCFLDWGPVHSILLRFIYVIAHDTSF